MCKKLFHGKFVQKLQLHNLPVHAATEAVVMLTAEFNAMKQTILTVWLVICSDHGENNAQSLVQVRVAKDRQPAVK